MFGDTAGSGKPGLIEGVFSMDRLKSAEEK